MLITIATFTNPLEAHIVRGRLQAEGIETYVAHEHHIWADWFLSTALGGVKLQVRLEDAQRAEEILRQELAGDFAALVADTVEETAEPLPACPECRSVDITPVRRSGRISLIIMWLSSLPLPYSSVTMACLPELRPHLDQPGRAGLPVADPGFCQHTPCPAVFAAHQGNVLPLQD